MAYSLKQAAEATGRTKPTILRAIQTGKISAKKTEMGEWEIEPAELHRVYPPVADGVTPTATPGMWRVRLHSCSFARKSWQKTNAWPQCSTSGRGNGGN